MRVLACLAALAASPAIAQQACAPHEIVAERLGERYGESRAGLGLTHDNYILEVWANPDSGTWTITMTAPGGPTCLAAAGEGWQALSETYAPGEDM